MFAVSCTKLARMTKDVIAKYPHREPEVTRRLQQMEHLLEDRKKKYREAQIAFDQKCDAVKEAKQMWLVGIALHETAAAAGVANNDDLIQQIKMDTAFDAVEQKVDSAFAKLETEVLELGDRQLKSGQPVTLEMEP